MQNVTVVSRPSTRQLKMITGLAWDLRPYYKHSDWQAVREGIIHIAFERAKLEECRQLIQEMVATLQQKKAANSKQYWLREEYTVSNPAYQNNLALLASSLLPDETTQCLNSSQWHKLKNRLERIELFYSRLKIPDTTFDNRPALAEQERWEQQNRHYREVVEGIDFLEATPGIDSPEPQS